MKKLIVVALALGVASLIHVSPVQAQEGDFEISGHVNTIVGWQRNHGSSDAGPASAAGILNDGLATPGTPETDQFGFFVDEAELDVAKQFGENIRLRTDLEFTPSGNRVGAAGGQVGVATGPRHPRPDRVSTATLETLKRHSRRTGQDVRTALGARTGFGT